MLATKIITSTLGESQYGELALAMTVPILLAQFAFGPLSMAILRLYPEYLAAGRLKELLAVLFVSLRRISLVVVAASVIGAAWLAAASKGAWLVLFVSAVVYGLLQNHFMLFGTMMAAARRRASVAVHQALDPFLRAAGAWALMVLMGPTAGTAMMGIALGGLVILTSQFIAFRREMPVWSAADLARAPEVIDAIWIYAWSFAVWGLFTWGYQASDRWSLQWFVSTDRVGLYAAAFQLASVPTMILGAAISQFIAPVVFSRAGEGTEAPALHAAARTVQLVSAAFLAWVAVAAVILWFLGSTVLTLLTSEAFRPGAPFVPLLVVALGLTQSGHLLGLIPQILKQLDRYRQIKIAHSILGIGLNLLGTWWAGVEGLCIAMIVGGALYVLAVLAVNRRLCLDLALAPSAATAAC